MKISGVILLITLNITLLFGQKQEGVWSLGGTFRFSGNSTPAYHSSYGGFQLITSTGYFYTNNNMYGLVFGPEYTKYNYSSPSVNPNSYSLGLIFGPFLRQYKRTGNGQFGFFLEELVMAEFLNSYISWPHPSRKQFYGQVYIRPGIYAFIGKHIAVEATFAELFYNYYRTPYTSVNYGLSMTASTLRFGVRYYFQRNLLKKL